MALRIGRAVRRMTSMAACLAMTLGLAACATDGPTSDNADDQTNGTQSQTASAGAVAIFTPSDGVTISGNTPLNKWTKFVPALTQSLRDAGVTKKRITASSADDLDKQSRDIQDYVVSGVSASDAAQSDATDTADAKHTTLVVAPVTSPDDTVRQYGDYLDQTVANSTDGGATDAKGSTEGTDTEAVERLASALRLAQENGMHVILLAGTIPGFQPDVYVRMSTAEQIGAVQARKLADKLELDKTSVDNPKNIEVLLPYSVAATDGSASGDAQDATPSDDSTAFAKAAFKGVWSVLQPYFQSGQAVSPSGMLTADTGDDDWMNVAFASSKDTDVRDELRRRLGMDEHAKTHTRIDGIIAMNDYVASGVVKELTDLGYTGSAADINPEITISGIVENITGKKDLQRGKVPDPIKAPEADGETTDGDDDADAAKNAETINARWPIVTGYGAYVDSMPQIVAGQQWMTALENRDALVDDVAKASLALNAGSKLSKADVAALGSAKINGKTTPVISEDLLAVSASNLKATLIDTGYISLAEAGL